MKQEVTIFEQRRTAISNTGENGAFIENEQKQIGNVSAGIVGDLVNYELTIQGSQNHAGTTSMSLRHDP